MKKLILAFLLTLPAFGANLCVDAITRLPVPCGAGANGATGATGPTGAAGSSSPAPYTLCASGCSTTIPASPFSKTAAVHGQGRFAEIYGYDNAGLRVALSSTIDSNGDFTAITYSGTMSLIVIGSGSGTAGATGTTGATGPTGPTGTLGPVTQKSANYTVTCADFTAYTSFQATTSMTFRLPTGCTTGWATFMPGTGASAAFDLATNSVTANGQSTLTTLAAGSGTAAYPGYILTANPASSTDFLARGTQGSTAASPVAGALLAPWGTVFPAANTLTSPLTGANVVQYYEFYIPSPGIVPTNLSAYANGSTQGHTVWGIYDAACTTLLGSTNTATPTTNAANNWTFSSPPSLAGGKYFLAWSADVSTTQFYGNANAFASDIVNISESGSSYRIFTGNASTGTTTITLPATCGTRTALSTSGGTSTYPAVAFH